MWVVHVRKDLVDLSKHYIHEIDALVSLDRAECFALEKKKKENTQKQLHSSSKNFVSRDLCTRCGPASSHALRTCLFKDTDSYILTCLMT